MAENKLVNASIVFIALIFLVLVLKTFKTFLLPLTFALILTILLTPVTNYLRKIKLHYSITLIGLIIILFIIFYLVGIVFYVQIIKVDAKLPVYERNLNAGIDYFTSALNLDKADINIKDLIDFEKTVKYATSGFNTFKSFISGIGLVILFAIFMIPYHRSFMRLIGSGLKKSEVKKFKSVMLKAEESIRNYLYVKIVISLLTAFLSLIVLRFFNIDFIIILAFIIFFLNFIPNIGSIIATIFPIVLYILQFGLNINLIWLILLLVLIQLILGNIVEPKFTSEKLNISPLIILLSLFFWYWVWGMAGMILSVPITSIIKIILEHVDSTKDIAKYLE